jgi:predicted phage tail protein
VLYTSTELKTLNHKPPLQPIGTYRWQVRARDAAGNWSPYCNYRTIEILAPFPAPPKLTLPAHKSTTSDTTPTLSWEQAGYAVGYEIQISLNYSFTKIVVQPTVNGQLSYTPNPLPVTGSGTTFYWRVRSINVYGQKGNWSSYRYFKVTQ